MRTQVEIITDKGAVIPFKKNLGDFEDFGYDLTATSIEPAKVPVLDVTGKPILKDGKPMMKKVANTYIYHTGIRVQIRNFDPNKCYGFSIRPRSSVWKTGMMLTNSTGTVDHGYTGEITLIFYHYNTDLPKYEVGDRIGQLFLSATDKVDFMPVNSFTDVNTSRGSNGYGSTGK